MRLDIFLVKKKMAESRSKAVHLIKQGKVLVNGVQVFKQSYDVKNDDEVELAESFKYVSRGGYKIEDFFKKAGITPRGKSVLDIGCSTGGFSDFMLQNGATEVVAVDIAKNIFSKKLLKDPRVKLIERLDASNYELLKEKVGDKKFDIITIDVSNISLRKILVNIPYFLKKDGFIVCLFKPQYEGGKGVIPESQINRMAMDFEKWLKEKGFKVIFKAFSPLRGGPKGKGNKEIFYLLKLV